MNVTPNWYWTHAVPKFYLQISWITRCMPLKPVRLGYKYALCVFLVYFEQITYIALLAQNFQLTFFSFPVLLSKKA